MNIKLEQKTVGNAEMAYAVFGNGPRPFVILPGVSPQFVREYAAAAAGTYQDGFDAYTFYLVDRRSDPPEAYSYADMADDTATLLQALGLTRVYLFGASQGGIIAMMLAARHPDLVEKLALGSTATHSDAHSDAVFNKWIRDAQAGDPVKFYNSFARDIYSAGSLAKFADALPALGAAITPEGLKSFEFYAGKLPGFDIRDETSKIQCPTLILSCEGDKVFDPATSAGLGKIRSCSVYNYGAEFGHAVFDEAPDYRQRLYQFFRENV